MLRGMEMRFRRPACKGRSESAGGELRLPENFDVRARSGVVAGGDPVCGPFVLALRSAHAPKYRAFVPTVDGVTHALSPLEDADRLKADVLAAARVRGGFLDVSVDGGECLSIYVSPASSITISAATIKINTGSTDGESPALSSDPDATYYDGDTTGNVI